MANNYNDTNAICQVIGNIYNNPSLLDIEDKYKIHEEDFCEDFHKIVFGSLFKLHELGAKEFTLENIADFLSSRPKSQAVYEANKGEEYLTKVSLMAEYNSFDYYYNRMKKMTLLRMYNKYGVDVTDIYDPDNILDVKKRQYQEEKLDNCTLREIADMVDSKIDAIRAKCVDNYTEDAYQAGEGIRQLVESFKEHPEVGIPMYGPLINTITRGARLKKFYLRSGATGLGKAIPDDTYIPTPTGPRQVKDIKINDYLFDELGRPTRVLGVYPQETLQDVWEVHFLDGRVAKCSGQHLWEYRFYNHAQYAMRTETTEEIVERINRTSKSFRTADGRYKFSIRNNKPVLYEKRELPLKLPPYMLGIILNLASFKNENLILQFKDTRLINKIHSYYPNYKIQVDENNTHIIIKTEDNQCVKLTDIIKYYSEINKDSKEELKIPDDYIYNNLENRRELLKGFLDAYINISGAQIINPIFKTINPIIHKQMVNLCRSLGLQINPHEKELNIKIKATKQDKIDLRSLQITQEMVNNHKYSVYEKTYDWVTITDIIPLKEKVKMTCFTVANPNHLFLMNDYIVTHNTRTMIADACFFACNTYYEGEIGNWIRNGLKEPTLYITTEQSLDEVQTMMLAFLSEVNEEHILNNTYEGDEEERIQKAIEVLEESPLYIEELPDFSLQDIENVIKKNIREHDVRYIVRP